MSRSVVSAMIVKKKRAYSHIQQGTWQRHLRFSGTLNVNQLEDRFRVILCLNCGLMNCWLQVVMGETLEEMKDSVVDEDGKERGWGDELGTRVSRLHVYTQWQLPMIPPSSRIDTAKARWGDVVGEGNHKLEEWERRLCNGLRSKWGRLRISLSRLTLRMSV